MRDNRTEPNPFPQRKGKLKIFFGYAAGVGKTYAMLDAARYKQQAGTDVVLGYLESHSGPDTMALAEGFDFIPTRQMRGDGVVLDEFDLDAVLTRRPQLVLVDELAHTNAPGCRHIKRYDDVEELLRAGIDVYTTLNVQNLESLNDIVASVTQVTVEERVPDFVFDKATQVELVDMAPDVLMERLKSDKKRLQPRPEAPPGFTRDVLAALREIALRRVADKVNKEVEQSRAETRDSPYVGEHILVCLSSSPSNAKVIRTAARFADAFHASFTALFVQTPHTKELIDRNRSHLRENLKLAQQLGAKIATVYGDDVAYQIAEFSRVSGVSKIVMGRSNNRHRLLVTRPSFVERLTALAPNLDVYIIPNTAPSYRGNRAIEATRFRFSLPDLAKTVAILFLCTVIGFFFHSYDTMQDNIVTVYILGVLIISNQTGSRIYGLASSFLSVFAYNYFFTNPLFTFTAYGPDYPITFVVMLAASLITSSLTMRVKKQASAAAVNAHRTGVLLETSRKLQRADRFEKIVERSSQQLSRLLAGPILFYPAKDGELQAPYLCQQDPSAPLSFDYRAKEERDAADWVFHNRNPAGISTETFPHAKALYLPVKGKDAVLAVVGVPMRANGQLEIFERSLLEAMIYEIAFAIEKYNLNEQQNQMKMNAEKERLRANLLRAISHDLRTPLTSISGNCSVLLAENTEIGPAEQHKILEGIYDDTLWLTNLVENILAITRIDDGRLSVQSQPELVQDLISEALPHIDRHSAEHPIDVVMDDDLLMVRVDAHLIVQTIINIINNAIVYTPPGSRITIHSFPKDNWAVVEIADEGNGLSDQDKTQIFDMFYTANKSHSDSRRGLGLGLSLCKSIINVHGGEIYVRDNVPHGAVFGFMLELEEVKKDR